MSSFYIILYLLLWVLTLIVYHQQGRERDAGWLIIVSYIGYAVFSLVLYQKADGEYYDFLPMRIGPFVYLYCMLLLALWPMIRFHKSNVTEIQPPRMWILHALSAVIILSALLCIPLLIKHLQDGSISRLMQDSSAGAELYSEALAESDESGSGISNIPSILLNALSDLALLLFFYYLSLRKRHPLLIAGLSVAIGVVLLTPILSGQRSNTVTTLLTLFGAYFLMRRYLGERLRRWVNILVVTMVVVISLPLAAITLSRFDQRQGGAIGSVVYYIGQANLNFNNYGLDAGGIRHGDRTMNLVKRVIDPYNTPRNFQERRDKYPDLKMDDNIFYTFVGDFTLDFGPWKAVLIFLVFNILVVLATRPKPVGYRSSVIGCRIIEPKIKTPEPGCEKQISFPQLLLLYMVTCIAMQGGFWLYGYSDTAGLRLIALLLLYFFIRFFGQPHPLSPSALPSGNDVEIDGAGKDNDATDED